MANYINGVSYPVFTIYTIGDAYDYGGVYVDRIEFPLCMEGGLTEEYSEDFKRVELENGRKVDYDHRGANIIFTLDYSSFIVKDDVFKIERIFAYNANPGAGFKIYLHPRADALPRFFEVRLLDGAFSLGVNTGGTRTPGNKSPVLKFITAYPGSKNMIDPDNLATPLPFAKLNSA